MIELNKKYSTKEISKIFNISYGSFRNNREEYEKHLNRFYDVEIEHKGNATFYTFKEKLYPYVSYREYKKIQKNNTIISSIKQTIKKDNRQTGSNIARVIIVDNQIQALDLELSTLTVYVREQLRELIKQKYYFLGDYRWCYLDRSKNKYVLMSDEEIIQLRSYFNNRDIENQEEEENILAEQEQGIITSSEANKKLGFLRKGIFIKGREDFKDKTGFWPIKVPVYSTTPWSKSSEIKVNNNGEKFSF